MKKAVDPETKEIIDSFVAEGYERLDDAEVQMEKVGCTDDSDCLGSVFRLFHSVKGSAGYLGFENVKLLTHEAETLLDLFIKKKTGVEPEAIDLILEDHRRAAIDDPPCRAGERRRDRVQDSRRERRGGPRLHRRGGRLRCFGHYPVRGRRRGGAPRAAQQDRALRARLLRDGRALPRRVRGPRRRGRAPGPRPRRSLDRLQAPPDSRP